MSKGFLTAIFIIIFILVCPLCFGLGFYFGNNVGAYYEGKSSMNFLNQMAEGNAEVLLVPLKHDWSVPENKREKYLRQLKRNMGILKANLYQNDRSHFLDEETMAKNRKSISAIKSVLDEESKKDNGSRSKQE